MVSRYNRASILGALELWQRRHAPVLDDSAIAKVHQACQKVGSDLVASLEDIRSPRLNELCAFVATETSRRPMILSRSSWLPGKSNSDSALLIKTGIYTACVIIALSITAYHRRRRGDTTPSAASTNDIVTGITKLQNILLDLRAPFPTAQLSGPCVDRSSCIAPPPNEQTSEEEEATYGSSQGESPDIPPSKTKRRLPSSEDQERDGNGDCGRLKGRKRTHLGDASEKRGDTEEDPDNTKQSRTETPSPKMRTPERIWRKLNLGRDTSKLPPELGVEDTSLTKKDKSEGPSDEELGDSPPDGQPDI